MKCSEWENKGILYFYGELEDIDEYKEHIKSCKICQKNLEFLKLIKESTSLKTPSQECVENICQSSLSSFEILREVTSVSPVKHRYIFNVFTVSVAVALLLLIFIKRDTFKQDKKILSEISYISERINEIKLSMLEEERDYNFRNELEELDYQIKNLSERIESL
ncbi:MAG: hypothetical protein ACK4JE_03345 [Endomicrobiia bacterium]